MDSVKIIFFDFDGTLFDNRIGRISDKTKYALHQLYKKGIKCCLITGRPPANLPDLTDLPFDVVSTFNGCFCCTETEVIYKNPIDPEEAKIVMANAEAIGRPVSIAVLDRLASNGIDQDLSDYFLHAGLELTVDEDFEEVCQEDIYQIMLGCREDQLEAIIQGTNHVKPAISWERAVDIIPLTGGKGSAVQHTLDYFHIDPSEAMAFGDSHNDLEMLLAVGTSVAMGNADEQVKAVAARVCGSVSEDGIYHYCIENGLIE